MLNKKIVQKLEIDDRVEKIEETEAFLTMKYRKGFSYMLSFRLINPSKSDIGEISKFLLDTINEYILKRIT